MISQRQRILSHLDKYGSITANEAMQEYGIMRLASRVAELRESGFPIISIFEKGKNRFGEPIKYVRYTLVDRSD